MPNYWLLYDSGCSVCAALAREVETRSGGRLGVRSLREPEIQALLDRVRPGWRWEPMLLEIEGERIRVFTGLTMRLRLVQILGPARALRVARVVARHGGPVLGVDWGRRDFLRRATGALAGWIALRGLGPNAETAAPTPPPPTDREGELWEGFLLLPPGAPIPQWIPCTPAPILCQTADPQAEAELRGDTHPMEPLEAWLPRLNFPLYWPTPPPPGLEFQGAWATVFRKSGAIFSVSLAFGEPGGEPRVRLVAQPLYPRPYPVWPVYRPERPEEPIWPEKVSFTPRPGLLLPSVRGHLALWQEAGVLYTLIAEHDPHREAAIALIRSLQPIHP